MTISQFPVVPVENERDSAYQLVNGVPDIDALVWRSQLLMLGWAAADSIPAVAPDQYKVDVTNGRAATPPPVAAWEVPIVGLAVSLTILGADDTYTLEYYAVPEGKVLTASLLPTVDDDHRKYVKVLKCAGVAVFNWSAILWLAQIESGGYFRLVETGIQTGVTLGTFLIKRLRYAKATQPA